MKLLSSIHAVMCALAILSNPLLSHSQPSQTAPVIDPFGPENGLPPDVTPAPTTESTPVPDPAPTPETSPVVTRATATEEEKKGFFGSVGDMVVDAASSTGQKLVDKATSTVKDTVLSGAKAVLPIPDIPWDKVSTYACYAAQGVNAITSLKMAVASSQSEIAQLKSNIAQLKGKSSPGETPAPNGKGMAVYPEKAPVTVAAFEADRMLGRWYQTMNNLFVGVSSQINATCPIFDFAYPAGTSVLNLRVGYTKTDENGTVGYEAYQGPLATPNASAPGQMLADFPSGTCAFEPIFLVALGPVSTTTGLYDWAIISDPYRMSVYALARDQKSFNKQYKKAVESALDTVGGFDGFLRKLRPSDHPSTCVYPEAFVAPVPPPVNETTTPSSGILSFLNPNKGNAEEDSGNSGAVLGAIIGTFIVAVVLVGLVMAFYVYGPQTRKAFGKKGGSDDELSQVGLAYH